MTQLTWRTYSAPIGELEIAATEHGIAMIAFGRAEFERKLRLMPELSLATEPDATASKWIDQAISELEEYFAGKRRDFSVPLDWLGATGFRPQTQDLLANIPYGETVTYGELAEMAGRPRAARAAGSACATNPLPLLRPCHRVLRSDGSIGQYGGTSEVKRYLLELEGWREHSA